MFSYIRWDCWVKHSLTNYSCNLCRKNSHWQIKESWNRATRTKWLKMKTGKHLRVFYRIQIFLHLPIFTGSVIVMETKFVTMFSLTSSDLVNRLTDLVIGNSDWSDFYKWYAQVINRWIFNGARVPLCQLNRFPSPEGFTLKKNMPDRNQKLLLVIEHRWLTHEKQLILGFNSFPLNCFFLSPV